MMSIRNVFSSTLLFAAFALTLHSPAPSGAADKSLSEPPVRSPIRIRVPSDAATLDWNKAADPPSVFLISQLMRGLFRSTPDGKVELDLAEKYEQTKTVVKIRIHEGLKWSDGKPLIAQHFADSINRMRDPKTATAFAGYISFVKNAKSTSDRDLEIELSRPVTHMNGLLSHPALFPIRKDLIEANPRSWTTPENLVVNGPYRLKQRTQDRKVVLKPNPEDYRYTKDMREIELLPLDSDVTAKNLFDTGELDLVLGISAVTARSTKNSKSVPLAKLTSVVLNQAEAAFNDPKIREALTLATSKAEIVKALGFGRKSTANWVHSQLRSNLASIPDFKSDFSRAKLLLKNAGYGEHKPLPKIVLSFPFRDDLQMCAEILQAQWSKLGFTVELEGRDPKFFYDGIRTGALSAALLTWNAGFPSALNYLEVLTSQGPAGALIKNKAYDKLVEEISFMTEGPKRDAKIKEAQELLISQEHRLVPLFEDTEIVLVSPKLSGLEFRAGRARLEQLRKR